MKELKNDIYIPKVNILLPKQTITDMKDYCQNRINEYNIKLEKLKLTISSVESELTTLKYYLFKYSEAEKQLE